MSPDEHSWLRARGLVCLLAASFAVLPEWLAIWYRYGPSGTGPLWGFTWRAVLLGLVPVAGYLVAETTGHALLNQAPQGLRRRIRTLSASRAGWGLFYALLFAGGSCLAWLLVTSSWKDFDFPFHMPWIDWERRFRSLAREVPLLALGTSLLGGLYGWFRSPARGSNDLPPMLARPTALALLIGAVFAVEAARRPLALFWQFAPITRPLAFLAFVVGFSALLYRREIPQVVALMGWTCVLGGAIGGGGLLLTDLASPGQATLALVDSNRSAASKVWVRLAGTGATPTELSCTPEAPPTLSLPTDSKQDLLLVTIDALQGGHVGSHGYHLPTTPVIDALAARGIAFTRAMTTAPSTKLALPGLLFSRPYECFGTTGEGLPSLFGQLRSAGYQTGVVTGYPLDVGVTREYADALLGPFDHVEYARDDTFIHDTDRVDNDVASAAVRLLKSFRSDQPIAMWVHFYDPHSVYNPEPSIAGEFGKGRRARYDAEVLGTDRALGVLLDQLRERRGDQDPLVVVTADHGESVEEVGARAHGYALVHPVLWVPLVITHPQLRGRRISSPVSLLDVGPTILDLLGHPPPETFMGTSLLPLASGEVDGWRPVRMAFPGDDGTGSVDQRVLHRGYKLVHKSRPRQTVLYGTSDIYELYQPEEDPAERRNLIEQRPRVAEALKAHLPYRVWNGEPPPGQLGSGGR